MTGFNDIIGNEEIKERLKSIIDEFKNDDESYKFRSIIFVGPIGKTLFSNAVINELGYKTFRSEGTKLKYSNISRVTQRNDNIIIFIDDYYDYSIRIQLAEYVKSIKNHPDFRTRNIFLIATYSDNENGDFSKMYEEHFEDIFDDIVYLNERWDHKYFKEIVKHYIQNYNVDPSINIDDLEGIFINHPLRNIFEVLDNAVSFKDSKNNYISLQDITKEYIKFENKSFFNEYHQCEFVSSCFLVVGEALKEDSSLFLCPSIQYYNSSLKEFNEFTEYPALDYPGLIEIIDYLDYKLSNVENIYSEIINMKPHKFIELTNNLKEVDYLDEEDIENNHILFKGILNNLDASLYHSMIDDFFKNEEEKKEWLLLIQEILRTNKDFFFKVYDELIKKECLYKSDIKHIKEETKIIPYKGEKSNG